MTSQEPTEDMVRHVSKAVQSECTRWPDQLPQQLNPVLVEEIAKRCIKAVRIYEGSKG